jgi:hypothetical protein
MPFLLKSLQPGIRTRAVVIGLLLILDLSLRLSVASRPLRYIDGLTIPDDAYISLHLARSIAEGLGPSYGGEYTNGFQPLYVFLMVPVFALVRNDLFLPIRISLSISCLVDALTLWILFRILRRWTSSLIPPLLLGTAWIFSPYVIATTLNGLETAIATCLVVWAWYLFISYRGPSGEGVPLGRWFLLGLVLGLAIFARIDTIFFFAGVTFTHLVVERKNVWRSVREMLIMAGAALLVNLPWLVYSYSYTGEIYPVSGKAVRFMSIAEVSFDTSLRRFYLPLLDSGLATIVVRNRAVVAGLAAVVLLIWLFRKRATKRIPIDIQTLLPGWLFAVFIFEAYTLYIFGSWFFPRYLYPLCIVLMVTFGWVLSRLIEGIADRKRKVMSAILVFLCCLSLNCLGSEFSRLFTSTDDRNLGYMNLGIWANRSFPAGTVLGGIQSGALGYFATDMKVLNLDGVVSRSCYDALVEGRGMEYIKRRRVQYVLGWAVNVKFMIQQSETFDPEELKVEKEIKGFRTWGRPWYLFRVTY